MLKQVYFLVIFYIEFCTPSLFGLKVFSPFTYYVRYIRERFNRDYSANSIIRGGGVKLEQLRNHFPHSSENYDCLYLVSSALPENFIRLIKEAKAKQHLIVWNQNGVAYPAWAPNTYQAINRRLRFGIKAANKVIYQSKFCIETVNIWLNHRSTENFEIIHNAVDTDSFTPPLARRIRPDTLLLCGTQQAPYRVLSAIAVLDCLKRKGLNWSLIIAGKLNWKDSAEEVAAHIRKLGLTEHVKLICEFGRSQAKAIYHSADILLHTKYNDPCPTVVLEALSCGMPVVGSRSGGLPELVDELSGVLISVPVDDYYQDHKIEAELAAEAVKRIVSDFPRYSRAARQRAVTMFDLKTWLSKHKKIIGNRTLLDYSNSIQKNTD
jgi:glycosyltransferase involved in cell wall biosynthesis